MNREKHSDVYRKSMINTGIKGSCEHLDIFYYININTREIRDIYIPLYPCTRIRIGENAECLRKQEDA